MIQPPLFYGGWKNSSHPFLKTLLSGQLNPYLFIFISIYLVPVVPHLRVGIGFPFQSWVLGPPIPNCVFLVVLVAAVAHDVTRFTVPCAGMLCVSIGHRIKPLRVGPAVGHPYSQLCVDTHVANRTHPVDRLLVILG